MRRKLTTVYSSIVAKLNPWLRKAYRMRRLLIVVALLVVLAAAAGYGTYKFFAGIDWGDVVEGSIVKDSTYREVPPGYFEYRTVSYHFSILFPEYMEVKEYGGNGDSLTVTFKEPEGEQRGFQIFATPYNDPVVGGERFTMDNPSGIYKEPQDVTIAGVRATIFYSANTQMGETREVWFIRNGMLYEVNAKRELDEWLAGHMKSWMFVR